MAEPILLTCVGVEHDRPLLPHFLAHYLDLGVRPEDVHVILNARAADDPRLEDAIEDLVEFGCAAPEFWIAPYTSDAMWARRRDLQDRVAPPDRWVLSADVDEFHDYPEPLGDFLARCEALGADCVQGPFVDRLAPGGRLARVEPEPDVLSQFPVVADVGRVVGGRGRHHDLHGTVKIMAMRGAVRPARGGHHPTKETPARMLYGRPLAKTRVLETAKGRFSVPTRVHHVHWTDSLPERLAQRLRTPGVSPAGAEYGRRQLDYLEAHGGVPLSEVERGPQAIPDGWEGRLARLRRGGPREIAGRLLRRLGRGA